MCFIIRHFRDGSPVGIPDRSITMYAARYNARARQEDLRSDSAVILGKTDKGIEREVEVIRFAN